MTSISFLIPALNEEKNIAECISAIIENCAHVPTYEIIVGDHGSSDRTATLAKSLGAVVHHFPGGSIASLRNRLVKSSSGKIVIFLDADVRLTPGWKEAIGSALTELTSNEKKITGSRCSTPESDNFILKHWFSAMPQDKHKYLGTGHIIFSRAVFDDLNGFDASLKTGEDYDFCMRAINKGISVIINPALKVIHHDYPLSIKDFVKRERWHGSGDFQSLNNIMQSKVALATVAFTLLHLLTFVFLLAEPALGAAFSLAIPCLITLFSCIRFPDLTPSKRIKNILIFYFYFVGRALSLLEHLPQLFHLSRPSFHE